MATGVGYLSILGAAREATYRTAVTVDNRLPLLAGESIMDKIGFIPSEALGGKSGLREYNLAGKVVEGGVPMDLIYDQLVSGTPNRHVGIGLPLAIAMGTCAWSSAGTCNVLTFVESPSVPMTLAFLQRTDAVREAISCFAKGFTISGSAGKPAKLELDVIAYNLLRTGTVNSTTTLNALPTVYAPRCLFSDMTFRIASDFADVLAAVDQIAISDFTLKLDNGMSDAEFATPESTGHTSSTLTLQPVRSGFRTVTLEFTVPRHTADTYFASFIAGTPYQAQITFTSGTKTFTVYLPSLVIDDPQANIGDAGVFPEKIKMRALRGGDYNAGAGNAVMLLADGSSLVTEEMAIEMRNERTAVIWS